MCEQHIKDELRPTARKILQWVIDNNQLPDKEGLTEREWKRFSKYLTTMKKWRQWWNIEEVQIPMRDKP